MTQTSLDWLEIHESILASTIKKKRKQPRKCIDDFFIFLSITFYSMKMYISEKLLLILSQGLPLCPVQNGLDSITNPPFLQLFQWPAAVSWHYSLVGSFAALSYCRLLTGWVCVHIHLNEVIDANCHTSTGSGLVVDSVVVALFTSCGAHKYLAPSWHSCMAGRPSTPMNACSLAENVVQHFVKFFTASS